MKFSAISEVRALRAASSLPELCPMKSESERPILRILGTRGVPACYGGFETFAEQLALHADSAGWDVHVYCQESGKGEMREDTWNGITRILIPEPNDNVMGTMRFDLKAAHHASSRKGVCLTLGYNTAIFTLLLRMAGRRTLMNMDGIEWSRKKWSFPARAWLYINEWFGARLNHVLIADHPEIGMHIQRHTSASKIKVIPYGAEKPFAQDLSKLSFLEIDRGRFAVLIARPEPENSILEIVQAWSRKLRGAKLVVLGNFRDHIAYHQEVISAASDEVVFPGAIYDKNVVGALRAYAVAYLHGHKVGGTNPSLVEALAHASPVIAHDNRFNRWVAGDGNLYFKSVDDCEVCIESILSNSKLREAMSESSRRRHDKLFRQNAVLDAYLAEISRCGYDEKIGMPIQMDRIIWSLSV